MPDRLWPLAGLLTTILVLVVIDVLGDLSEGVALHHVAGEAVVFGCAGLGLAIVVRRMQQERRHLSDEVRRLRAESAEWHANAARWRAEAESASRGFVEAVEDEFRRWQLSSAEREIALLLLKGASLKEIANARGTAERTVRQQATAIYAKAGVAGRSELASYFLDVLPGGD